MEAEGLSVALEQESGRFGARRALAESACVIVLWSKTSAREDGAAIDAAQAFNQGKLLSARLHEIEPPYPFSLVPSLDLADWRGGRDEPHWRDITQNVRAVVADKGAGHIVLAPPPPPPPQPPPPPRPPVQTPNIFQTPRKPEAPPPSVAHEADPAPPDEPRPLRRPPPPRADNDISESGSSRLAPILVAAAALLAAGLWGGPRLIALLNPPPETAHDGPAEPGQPPEFARVPPVAEPPAAPAPEPAAVVAPVEPSPAETPDPATTLAALETCLAELAKQCGRLDAPIAQSFKADGALSAGEKRLLGSPLFPDRSLVTVRNVNACLGAKTPAQRGRACPSIAAKVEPPVIAIKPAIPDPIKTPEPPPEPIAEPSPSLSAPKPPTSQPEL